MSKEEFIIVFDFKDGYIDSRVSFDKIIDYLLKNTFKNEAFRISSRAIYCYTNMSETYPDAPALIENAFCSLADIENDYDLEFLSENYVVYNFKPDENFLNHLKKTWANEISYLHNGW